MKRCILVAGFAQPPEALNGLANGLSGMFKTTLTSVSELIVPSLRNSLGTSDWEPGEPSLYAQSLALMLHSAERTTLLGWSMGGMVAIEVARFFPELVDALVLCGSSACFTAKPNEGYSQGLASEQLRAFRLALQSEPLATLERFFSAVYSGEDVSDQTLRDKVAAAMAMESEVLLHGVRYLQHSDLRAFLPHITARTMVLHGEQDMIIPPSAGRYLIERLGSHATSVFFPDGSHGMFDCRPMQVLPEIEGFFDK